MLKHHCCHHCFLKFVICSGGLSEGSIGPGSETVGDVTGNKTEPIVRGCYRNRAIATFCLGQCFSEGFDSTDETSTL